jgi:hypothetical protein
VLQGRLYPLIPTIGLTSLMDPVEPKKVGPPLGCLVAPAKPNEPQSPYQPQSNRSGSLREISSHSGWNDSHPE